MSKSSHSATQCGLPMSAAVPLVDVMMLVKVQAKEEYLPIIRRQQECRNAILFVYHISLSGDDKEQTT